MSSFMEIKFKTGESREDRAFKARPMVNSKSRSPEDTPLPTSKRSANPMAEACCGKRMKLGSRAWDSSLGPMDCVASVKTLTPGPSCKVRVTALALCYGLT